MASLNRVILIGRLTRDPELRYTASEVPVTSFSIAVDRRTKSASGEKVTDFFRCTAWRQTAEFVNNYITKGRLVAVEGRIEINKFTGQDGQERQVANIVCDNVQALESARDREDSSGGGYAPAPSAPARPSRPQSQAPAPARPAAPAKNNADFDEFDDFDDSDPFGDE